MEALLSATQNSSHTCGSVADLRDNLRGILSSKVTETRAEHVSLTLGLRSTTIFDVPVFETESEALENASNIDPLLGGSRSSVAPVSQANDSQQTRKIKAIDTLINQPLDDHVLQNSVAKHIISSLGEVDGSSWTVRQVSRNDQGWTFTHICKHSRQAWSRQNSKNPARITICEWSNKDGQDPVNLGRPAFDCRGSVTIAFVRSTRSIDVKYDHTPMHKTVSQLIDLLIPPPEEPAPVVNRRAAKEPKERPPRPPRPPKEPKSLKELKAPRPPKTPKSSKKRQAENGQQEGETSQPKKRWKKKDSTAGANGTVVPPEMPGALPVGQDSDHQLYNTTTQSYGNDGLGVSGSYAEGLVGSSTANGAGPRSKSQASDHGGVHSQSILNLPPGEAARRRDVAMKLLSDQGTDPQTLSPDQFNIFANQSSKLQHESLAMLVKYGAERLHIVHPTKNGEITSQDASAGYESAANHVPALAPAQSQSAPDGPSKIKKSRKRKSDQAVEAIVFSANANGKGKERCDKIKPSCTHCVTKGYTCIYPAAKPRKSRTSEALSQVVIDDEEEQQQQTQQEQQQQQ
ncbi:hypothetical protein B0H63DRAFT_446563 [Podospora didyma]|uniref:Uncharacterized protein n=1 Tax=Podospora didyma TaxID=330526 RepID=A0AAE0U4L9_9PEZI|nr:hypothetical protein B0H63DRAFT_446563 [Podospora didyma]